MKRYLVLTLRRPQFNPVVVAPHYERLARLRERGQLELSGPVSDKSGGACIVRADTLEAARAIAFSDPVHVSGSSEVTVWEWNAA